MGVVLVVINVPAQRMKSRQSVARANVTKSCAAFTACLSASLTGVATDCDTWVEIGATQPTQPIGAAWTIAATGPSVTADTCTISCNTGGTVTTAPATGGTCYIQ